MHDTQEGRAAKRILDALERGGTAMSDAAVHAGDLDPVLVHAIVSYARDAYPVSSPAGSGVLQRLVQLTSANPALQALYDAGARDPVVEWFKSAHDWREFRGRSHEMIDILVDKLES
jgi:hypothetical protein